MFHSGGRARRRRAPIRSPTTREGVSWVARQSPPACDVTGSGWRGQARLCGLDHDLGGSARGGVVKSRLCGLDHDELGAGARMKERGQQVGHATQSMCMNGAIR